MGLKELFSSIVPKGGTMTQQAEIPVSPSETNSDSRRSDETYESYGARICGLVYADVNCLTPFLQRIYTSEYQRFVKDESFQAQEKLKIQNKIAQKETDRQKTNNAIESANKEIEKKEREIENWRGEIAELKSNDRMVNKEASIKLYLGTAILLLLSVYLFIFYSSTFYSAFFKDFVNGNTGIGAAMFDSSALVSALRDGVGELIFICTAPVIFMALGYSLHYFNAQKGWGKVVKSGVCILITFFFDCILAYLIGKKLYDVEVMSILTAMPPYSISAAIADGNIWAVIFCGFITYMIWGIVLDMTLSAYNELKFNKSAIEILENKITKANAEIANLLNRIAGLKNQQANINGEIVALNNELSKVFVPRSTIKTALNDFFAGWTTLAGALKSAAYNAPEAKSLFDSFISNIDKKD